MSTAPCPSLRNSFVKSFLLGHVSLLTRDTQGKLFCQQLPTTERVGLLTRPTLFQQHLGDLRERVEGTTGPTAVPIPRGPYGNTRRPFAKASSPISCLSSHRQEHPSSTAFEALPRSPRGSFTKTTWENRKGWRPFDKASSSVRVSLSLSLPAAHS